MDFLVDPQWLAAFGTLAGAVGLRMMDKFFQRKRTPTLASAEPAPKGSDKFSCAVYETHVFEQKLADEGVLTKDEITLCEDKACELCKPERTRRAPAGFIDRRLDSPRRPQRIDTGTITAGSISTGNGLQVSRPWAEPTQRERYEEARRMDSRYNGYRFEDWKFQDDMRRAEQKRLDQKALQEQKEFAKQLEETKRKAAEYKEFLQRQEDVVARNKAGRSRKVIVNNIEIERPPNVPSFAVPAFSYDTAKSCDVITWQWTYEDGKMHTYHQRIDFESLDVKNGDGAVVNRWIEVHDPVTGEHLGDVKTDINGKSILRDAPAPLKFEPPEFDYYPKGAKKKLSTLDLGPS